MGKKVTISLICILVWLLAFHIPFGGYSDFEKLKKTIGDFPSRPSESISRSKVFYFTLDDSGYDLSFKDTVTKNTAIEKKLDSDEYCPIFICNDNLLAYGQVQKKTSRKSRIIIRNMDTNNETVLVEENGFLFPEEYDPENEVLVVKKFDHKTYGLGIQTSRLKYEINCTKPQ